MKTITILLICSLFLLSCQENPSDKKEKYYEYFVEIDKNDNPDSIIYKAAHLIPSQRQLDWQKREFTCFIHFTVNTFTGREWGDGTESPDIFNPTELDVKQWVQVTKDAGMKMIILTCKHHDGFCLWPSAYTEHSVKNSPYKDGKGDIVKELSDACREAGLDFGVYLSPWDRNHSEYGNSPVYNEYFINQLTELLTNYGDIAEVWFDGACGEGPNGKKQEYDWNAYYKTIRELQPNAVIFGMGPDVRWVGNESGLGRETEWSVVAASSMDLEGIAEASQTDEKVPILVPKDRTDKDLGSRKKILGAYALIWYPAETDVSIRPGWFYHEEQDSLVKTPEHLIDIYYKSIGRNGVLLLNIPPDKRGLIHENDVLALQEMKKTIDGTFKKNFAHNAVLTPKKLIDGNRETYCESTCDDYSDTLILDLKEECTFDVLMLQEYIEKGQRVEKFTLEYFLNGKWIEACQGTTIGYKRLIRFDAVTAKKVRLIINESRHFPMLSEIGLFKRV